jgi:uroporphyrinogen decarboxylase
MHYEKPERMFNWNRPFGFYADTMATQFWHQTIERWHMEGLPPEIDSPVKVNDYFEADRSLRVILRVGVWPEHEKEVVEEDGEYEVFYDVDGSLVRQFKGAKYETAMPQHIKYPLSNRSDWEVFQKERLDPEAPGRECFEIVLDGEILLTSSSGAENFAQAQEIIRESRWPVEITVGSQFGWVRNWMGLTGLSYMLYDDEQLVAEIMNHLADLSLSVVSRFQDAVDAPIDYATWWEDMAYNKGPLISPKHVEKLMVPNYQRVNEVLYSHGINIIGVDSDGDLDKLIPLWLEGGINFVYPNEVAAGNDVLETRKKHGSEMRLVGGIDKRTLAQGKAAIQKELDRRLPLVAQGGYLPSIDHSVPPDISLENYTYYVELHKSECARYINQMEI